MNWGELGMSQIGNAYAQALYSLVKDEGNTKDILGQLTVLEGCFRAEPDFLRLLDTPNIPKDQRCRILDDSFRGKVDPYVLNFMKILTERGYIRQFADCCHAYREQYNEDNGILPVCAVTAVPLDKAQTVKLTAKLTKITGKTVELTNRIDPACLGGVRLDYDGKRVDGTVQSRLDAIRSLLKNTVL